MVSLYLAAVPLGFSTLSGTNPQIETAKMYDKHKHPRHFYMGVPPPPPLASRI